MPNRENPLASLIKPYKPHNTEVCDGEGGQEGRAPYVKVNHEPERKEVCPSVQSRSKVVAAINDPEWERGDEE